MGTTTSGQPLTHTAFSKPPLHIPNSKGEPFKTELVEVRDALQTIKWNFWHLPDEDRAPHNHPWTFESTIHHGGYTERRHWLDKDGKLCTDEVSFKAGDTNRLYRHIFHQVTKVSPGTVTRMVCGEATEGNAWGYLNIETLEYTRAEMDPSFMGRLHALNPFLKSK